jgi:hypothetical protein
MRTALFTQPIDRPAEEIWAFIGDLRNDRRWRREVVDVELLSGEPPGAPATYQETVEWEGVKTRVLLRVSESVRASRVIVLNEGEDYTSRSVWAFEPHGGSTIVTLSFSFETSGALRIAEPFAWTVVSRWLARDLPLLEGHLSSF